MKLKCGTRQSLLSKAQSQWVADQLSLLGCDVELVEIKTKGDIFLETPLSQLPGKDFFVQELDQALLNKKVDFTVHSLKDLSIDRPKGIQTAAISHRKTAQDMVVFSRDMSSFFERFFDAPFDQPIRVGSSSLRRQLLVPPFLSQIFSHQHIHIQWEMLRGNINTRLERLHEPRGSSRALDAVVLAYAGILRLKEAQTLIKGLKTVLLPLTDCPGCAGQGALAIECRVEDQALFQLLQSVHDAPTQEAVDRERDILKKAGGGCHQAFGVTQLSVPAIGQILFIKGHMRNKEVGQILRELPLPCRNILHETFCFDGTTVRAKAHFLDTELKGLKQNVFIAHARAVRDQDHALLKQHTLWTAGVSSWSALHKKGLFVKGCAEGLGFSFLKNLLSEEKEWSVLTHTASKDWPKKMDVHYTYALFFEKKEALIEHIQKSYYFYWTSGSQYMAYRDFCPKDAHHACGIGKTYDMLIAQGLKPQAFLSHQEWKQWIIQE